MRVRKSKDLVNLETVRRMRDYRIQADPATLHMRHDGWSLRTARRPNEGFRMSNTMVAKPSGRSRLLLPLFLFLHVASCSRNEAAATRTSPASDLVGAWRAKLQFDSGAFAAVKNLEFMYVFNAGGTLTESSNYDGAPPVPPAYGVWRETGPQQFEAKYAFYITQAPKEFAAITSGGGWLPNGHGVFTERITLAPDGQSFESSITYQVFDSLGAAAPGGGPARGHGVRIAF